VRFLLDTNACIGMLRGRTPRLAERLEAFAPEDVALCSIVVGELLFGALKSARREQNLAAVRLFASKFYSLPFDDDAAEHYSRIRAELDAIGLPIGPNDLMIASIARAKQLVLVSHNVSEFGRVQGLRVEDWEM